MSERQEQTQKDESDINPYYAAWADLALLPLPPDFYRIVPLYSIQPVNIICSL